MTAVKMIRMGICLTFLCASVASGAGVAGDGDNAKSGVRWSQTEEPPDRDGKDVCPCLQRARWPSDPTWVEIVESGSVDRCREGGNVTIAAIGSVSAIVEHDGDASECRSEEGFDPPRVIDTLGPISEVQAEACAAVLRDLC